MGETGITFAQALVADSTALLRLPDEVLLSASSLGKTFETELGLTIELDE